MKPRIIETELGNFTLSEWNGKNESRIRPIGDHAVVLPDQPSGKAGKLGLIDLTPSTIREMALAAETGVLVAVGAGAFMWSTNHSRPFVGEMPKVGDRVIIERYSGKQFLRYGKYYRIMSDICIAGIDESAEEETQP